MTAPESDSLAEVVVTARRQSERSRDVPITVTVQTGEELVNAGVTDTRALAATVPGLVISQNGGYFQPSLRGISGNLVQVGSNSPVAVYIDGVYQPNLMADLFDLPDVERMEVLKGPQGTLFGRNASAGAISVYTKDPSFTPTGSISLADGVFFGSNVHTSNDYQVKLNLSGPLIPDLLAGSITGYYDDVPGYMTNDVTNTGTGLLHSYIYRGKLLFTPTENLKFVATAFHSSSVDDANQSVTPEFGVTVASLYPGAIYTSLPWHVASEMSKSASAVNTEQTGESLRTELRLPGTGTLTALSAFTTVNTLYFQDVDAAYAPSCVAVFVCITPYQVNYGPDDTFQQELTFASDKMGRFEYVAGLFYYHDWADYGTAVNPPLTPGGVLTGQPAPYFTKANDTTTAYALFGELNTDLTGQLHLTTGIRYSWEKQVADGSIAGGPTFDVGGKPTWTAWTPRVSVRYDVNDNANVYATYSEGFKGGVLDTISLTQNVAQPEKLRSYEIGSKYGSARLNLNLSFFYYDYRDQQVSFFLANSDTVIGNAAKSTLYGLDFDGTVLLGGGFQLRAAVSWLPHAVYDTLQGAIDYHGPINPVSGIPQVIVDASGARMQRAPVSTANITLNYHHDTSIGAFDAAGIIYESSAFSYDTLLLHTSHAISAEFLISPKKVLDTRARIA